MNFKDQQSKDILGFFTLLNIWGTYEVAMYNFKSDWLNHFYPLPSTSDKRYNAIKQSRYLALKRVKKAYRDQIDYIDKK